MTPNAPRSAAEGFHSTRDEDINEIKSATYNLTKEMRHMKKLIEDL